MNIRAVLNCARVSKRGKFEIENRNLLILIMRVLIEKRGKKGRRSFGGNVGSNYKIEKTRERERKKKRKNLLYFLFFLPNCLFMSCLFYMFFCSFVFVKCEL